MAFTQMIKGHLMHKQAVTHQQESQCARDSLYSLTVAHLFIEKIAKLNFFLKRFSSSITVNKISFHHFGFEIYLEELPWE